MSTEQTPPKYQVEDREILLSFYQKLFWTRLVGKLPASLPPNAITVFGQCCVLLGAVSAAGAVLGGQPLLYAFSALLLLAYMTADNVDGPHARRTGQCSPLGEFLDHGLDGLASGAILLTAAFVIRLDPLGMVLLAGIGALGFMTVFWEQYRTGVLVIPRVSSLEGTTVVMALSLTAMIANDPAWLHASLTEFNFTSGVLVAALVGYAVAAGAPILRASRKGTSLRELGPILTVGASLCAPVAFGAGGIMPAVAVSVFGADLVGRMILLRHRKIDGALLPANRWLAVAPLAPLAMGVGAPNTWAAVSMLIALGMYGSTLMAGVAHMGGRAQADRLAA